MSAGCGSSECQMSELVLSPGLFSTRPAAQNNVVSVRISRCASGLLPGSFVVESRWRGGEARLHSKGAAQRGERHRSSSQDCRELLNAMGRMGQKSWLPFNYLFSMNHRGPEVDLASSARSGVSFEVEPVPWGVGCGTARD